jgi:hypothetical protein
MLSVNKTRKNYEKIAKFYESYHYKHARVKRALLRQNLYTYAFTNFKWGNRRSKLNALSLSFVSENVFETGKTRGSTRDRVLVYWPDD